MPELVLKRLLPDDLVFDLAMNIFTFPPGFALPVTETHVMEHGLYMLEGQGLYYLGRDWHEVNAGDFIWMGPYCPQSFYATSSDPSRYIYYKNVNRDVELAP
jgi:(S)-ureidoglycine aminohydrolase